MEIYKVLYLFDADEIDFSKIPKDTFVIYHGHHGDKAVNQCRCNYTYALFY